ncbi:MAG: LysM domain-containing protein [Actinocatenispora sp.]
MSETRPVIGEKYTIQEGDTITEIAFLAYDDARRYRELAAHNADVPGFNPARLTPGLVIDVPQPDYLPMPGGIGGMRSSAGRVLSLRASEGSRP